MNPYRERRYTAQDGLSLYYRDYGGGDAAPVLCLPGLTRNSKDFHSLATHFSRSRRIVCPDYRGRGRSDYDPVPGNYVPATYLSDLRHLLAAAGIGHVVVVGTSLGGLLAMAMGAAMPTVLTGVVLNDIGPEIGEAGLERIVDFIGTDRPHESWDSATTDLRRAFPNLTLESDGDWREAAMATWREGSDGLLHFDWDVRLVETLRRGPPAPDLWPLFDSLARVPTLAIRGERSDVLREDTFARMATKRPDLQQATVPEAGHVPTLREPVALRAIDEFLASL